MTNQRPNIIFILIDDMGWKDLGCYGSTFYETPNIDRLAKQGMTFTDAYAACPVCSPTRASILSGKYPANVGVTDYIALHREHPARGRLVDAAYVDHLPLKEKCIAAVLKEGGYNTWHVGKWHLGERPYYPENHGFDVNIAGNRWGYPWKGYFSPYQLEALEEGPEGEYLTDRLTDEAVKLIKNNNDKPFFLNLWHYTVHMPPQAKEEHIKYFEEKAKAMGLEAMQAFEEGEFFPCEHKKHLRIKRRLIQSDPVYAAMIYSLDEGIGKIMNALEETGQHENTVIFFTSDNGGLATAEGSPTTNAPLSEGKGWMYEGGVREPLLVWWPGVVKEGSVCTEPVTSPDFYPTFLEIANLPLMPEQHVDGVSLLPLMKEEGHLDRESIYWHYPHYGNQGGTPGSSVRVGDYKLIEFFEDGRLELYNLREDIGEEHNLVGLQPDRARYMQQLLSKWRTDIEAKLPEQNPNYVPWERYVELEGLQRTED
jgi:arylsulfatase A-like enzyme